MRYRKRMNIFLLRHGLAVEREEMDFAGDDARPLTPKGRRQLRKVAAAMRLLKLDLSVIFSSPLVRAQQTTEVIVKQLKFKRKPVITYDLRPGGNAEKLIHQLAALKPVPRNILLVGHEPDLSELLSLLVAGTITGGFSFKKAGLAKLETEKLRAGQCATLAWQLTPGQMKLMK